MLKSYPDYGKSPPEYLAGIVQIFASYEPDIQRGLADPKHGIRGRCSYLPTIADVVKLADELIAKRADREAFDRRYNFERHVLPEQRVDFIPFPQLWKMFADEPDLLHQRPFDTLHNAFMAMRQGKDAARMALLRNHC